MENTFITEGAILKSSWGYDQTNIDFFKVTKVSNGWAWIQAVGQNIVEYMPQYMSENVVPSDQVIGKVMRRKIKNYGDDFVAINSYAGASVWNGKPQYQSHTH